MAGEVDPSEFGFGVQVAVASFVKWKGVDFTKREQPNFAGQRFDGANFEGTIFVRANFRGSTFTGNTSFEGVTFEGSVKFSNADLGDVELLSKATWKAGAQLRASISLHDDAKFGDSSDSGRKGTDGKATMFPDGKTTSHAGANFHGAKFVDAVFNTAKFVDANFRGTTFSKSADFKAAEFYGWLTDFSAATFQGDLTDFSAAKFGNIKLHGLSKMVTTFWNNDYMHVNENDFEKLPKGARFAAKTTTFAGANFVGTATFFVHTDFKAEKDEKKKEISFKGTDFDADRTGFFVVFDRARLVDVESIARIARVSESQSIPMQLPMDSVESPQPPQQFSRIVYIMPEERRAFDLYDLCVDELTKRKNEKIKRAVQRGLLDPRLHFKKGGAGLRSIEPRRDDGDDDDIKTLEEALKSDTLKDVKAELDKIEERMIKVKIKKDKAVDREGKPIVDSTGTPKEIERWAVVPENRRTGDAAKDLQRRIHVVWEQDPNVDLYKFEAMAHTEMASWWRPSRWTWLKIAAWTPQHLTKDNLDSQLEQIAQAKELLKKLRGAAVTKDSWDDLLKDWGDLRLLENDLRWINRNRSSSTITGNKVVLRILEMVLHPRKIDVDVAPGRGEDTLPPGLSPEVWGTPMRGLATMHVLRGAFVRDPPPATVLNAMKSIWRGLRSRWFPSMLARLNDEERYIKQLLEAHASATQVKHRVWVSVGVGITTLVGNIIFASSVEDEV